MKSITQIILFTIFISLNGYAFSNPNNSATKKHEPKRISIHSQEGKRLMKVFCNKKFPHGIPFFKKNRKLVQECKDAGWTPSRKI